MLKKVLLAVAFLAFAALARADTVTQILNLNGVPVTVNTTPTLIVGPRVRSAVTLTVPTGGVTVYISSSNTVTTSTGFPLLAASSLTLQPFNGPVYGVVTTGTQVINEAETY